jgi:MSHA biogenesis protein MshQ
MKMRTRTTFAMLGRLLGALLLVALLPPHALATFALGTCEDFEAGLGSWTVAASGSAAAATGTQTAQTGTSSLYTRSGAVTVTSNTINLSAGLPGEVTVWIRRGGTFSASSDRPEAADTLLFQWRTTATGWTTFETFPGIGSGNGGQTFTRAYALPAAALAAGFQVRFNQTQGTANADYWHADNVCVTSTFSRYSLDETSWTGAAGEVADDGGWGADGTAFGGAATANSTPSPPLTGNPGTCRYGEFDGNNEYVEVPSNALHDLPTDLTLAAWVRMETTPAELHTIVSKDTNYEFHIDDGRHVYWWWTDSGGTARSITTNATIALNTWVHIAVTYTSGSQVVYIDGVSSGTLSRSETLEVNDLPLYIGTDWNFLTERAFDGQIDEVHVIPRALSAAQVGALRTRTHPCPSAAVQFTINHDGFGLNCEPETVTVNVIDAVAGTPRTDYNAQVTLDTQQGFGTWSLVTGSGTFSEGTANDGVATYTWPLGQSQAVFTLYYPQGAAAVDTDVFQTSDTTIRDTDAEGALSFYPSAFTVTAALYTPPAAITTFAAPQTAGTSFTLYLTAYGTTPTDTACGVIETYTGNKSLKFWQQYVNPATGTLRVAITGASGATDAALTEAAALNQTVAFANGRATVSAKYKDVGMMRILMKDNSVVNATDLPNGIAGATANFVVRPYDFVFSNIQDQAQTISNPSGTNADAAGSVFISAGSPFRATVTVRDSEGSATPNFGRETGAGAPDYVRLVPTLHAPVGGNNPAISPPPPTSGFGAFANGVATGTSFSWSEVGIIRVQGAIGDGDYLGAGDVIGPTQSERIGRFVPHRFNVALNAPTLTPGCSAGGFTYQGQPFSYGTAPVITATAVAVGGSTTLNYAFDGGTAATNWFKIRNATTAAMNKTYSSLSGNALNTAGIASPDPAIANVGGGNATLSFNSGTGLSFNRTLVGPFAAGVQLAINVVDSDGVTTATSPTVFGSAGGIAFVPLGDSIRYGRVRIATALGSERVDLPVRMLAEQYSGSAAGFVTNTSDTCSTNVTLAFSGYTENLAAGETCVRDSGSPGASGVGCAAPAALGIRFTEPPAAGDFRLRLAAPGAGNTGSVLIDGAVPAWLRFDWNTALGGEENPTGQATFGLFGGESRQIYLREVYQ